MLYIKSKKNTLYQNKISQVNFSFLSIIRLYGIANSLITNI